MLRRWRAVGGFGGRLSTWFGVWCVLACAGLGQWARDGAGRGGQGAVAGERSKVEVEV